MLVEDAEEVFAEILVQTSKPPPKSKPQHTSKGLENLEDSWIFGQRMAMRCGVSSSSKLMSRDNAVPSNLEPRTYCRLSHD